MPRPAGRSIAKSLQTIVIAGLCLIVAGCAQQGISREAAEAVGESPAQSCFYGSALPWTISNDLPIPVTVRTFDVDPYDWMGDTNPNQLDGHVIQPRQSWTALLKVNCMANGAPFGVRFEQDWNGNKLEMAHFSFDREYECLLTLLPVPCGIPGATKLVIGWGYRGGPDDANLGCLKSGTTPPFIYRKIMDDQREAGLSAHGQVDQCVGFRLLDGWVPS